MINNTCKNVTPTPKSLDIRFLSYILLTLPPKPYPFFFFFPYPFFFFFLSLLFVCVPWAWNALPPALHLSLSTLLMLQILASLHKLLWWFSTLIICFIGSLFHLVIYWMNSPVVYFWISNGLCVCVCMHMCIYVLFFLTLELLTMSLA